MALSAGRELPCGLTLERQLPALVQGRLRIGVLGRGWIRQVLRCKIVSEFLQIRRIDLLEQIGHLRIVASSRLKTQQLVVEIRLRLTGQTRKVTVGR